MFCVAPNKAQTPFSPNHQIRPISSPMAVYSPRTAINAADLSAHHHVSSLLITSSSQNLTYIPRRQTKPLQSSVSITNSRRKNFHSLAKSSDEIVESVSEISEKIDGGSEEDEAAKRLSEQSSWEAKDLRGNDYLYRLGAEADNMNIAVGAKSGVIDDLFTGDFLGRDFVHIVKNYIAHLINAKVPLILGIWGGKGQGKSFQTELIFRALGVEPVIMSAGELESERAGEPGKLIRERYRTASQVIQNQGKMSCLMINDLDAGLGRFGFTQMTVNNQIVVGTLMNLSDNPTRVSVGQNWRDSDTTHRVPIIVTGNDLSTIYAPLIRDGRMDKFYWEPTQEDILNIVHRMYEKDGISKDEVATVINTFPNQALDFYGALRSRTYDRSILKWVDEIGGMETLGAQFLNRKKAAKLPVFVAPEQTVEALLESGHSLVKEQELVMNTKLSKEYMKNMDD